MLLKADGGSPGSRTPTGVDPQGKCPESFNRKTIFAQRDFIRLLPQVEPEDVKGPDPRKHFAPSHRCCSLLKKSGWACGRAGSGGAVAASLDAVRSDCCAGYPPAGLNPAEGPALFGARGRCQKPHCRGCWVVARPGGGREDLGFSVTPRAGRAILRCIQDCTGAGDHGANCVQLFSKKPCLGWSALWKGPWRIAKAK